MTRKETFTFSTDRTKPQLRAMLENVENGYRWGELTDQQREWIRECKLYRLTELYSYSTHLYDIECVFEDDGDEDDRKEISGHVPHDMREDNADAETAQLQIEDENGNSRVFGIESFDIEAVPVASMVAARKLDSRSDDDSPSEWFGDVADRIEDRGDVHEDSFSEIADLWATYLDADVDESDVANMMVLLKVARNANGVYEADNYTDIAGYAYWGDRKEGAE